MYSESHGHLRNLSNEAIEQAFTQAALEDVKVALIAGIDLPSSKQAIQLAKS